MIFYYGIFSFTDQEILMRDIEAMNASVSRSHFKDVSQWHSKAVFFAQKSFGLSPEAENEVLPLVHFAYNLTLVGEIRLDNRNELITSLKISPALSTTITDAQLTIEAYNHWKENCSAHLLGDFAFAIYDSVNKKIFCCRDHFGIRSFLYYYKEGKFVFASRASQIIAVEGVDNGVNMLKLASLIYPPVKNAYNEDDWCENIKHLPGGTSLIIDQHGLQKTKYWTPSLGKELHFKNEADYADAFQEIFFQAVSDRMRSSKPVSALLSGGLDSSAIVAVAAKILEKQNKTLHTFSAVLPDPNDKVLKDERFYIDQFKAFPNVQLNYVTAPGKGFFSDLQNLEEEVIPPVLNSRHFFYETFADELRKIGSHVILDGGGGELGPTMNAHGAYAEMLTQFKFWGLAKELSARKKVSGRPIHKLFLSEVIKPFIKKQKQFAMNIDHNCLKDDFVEVLLDIIDREKGNMYHSAFFFHSPRQNQLEKLHAIQKKSLGSYSFNQVDFRFPMKDKRLLEFCLNVPTNLKVKNGYYRNLIRAGLGDILPPEIRWRTSKSPMNVDYNRRFKAQMAEVQQFLNGISPNDPIRRIVDIEKVKKWTHISLKDNELGTQSAKIALNFLPGAIYLIFFLRHFKEFKK